MLMEKFFDERIEGGSEVEQSDAVETLYEGAELALRRQGGSEYVERVHVRGVVLVLAVTEVNRLVLVERYRPALHARTVELPIGVLRDDRACDETPERCALRELERDTGYHGVHARLLTSGPGAPGLTADEVYLVHVNALDKPYGKSAEQPGVSTVFLDRTYEWLQQKRRTGCKIDPQIYAGLFFLSGFPF